jgi:hypothetical protein
MVILQANMGLSIRFFSDVSWSWGQLDDGDFSPFHLIQTGGSFPDPYKPEMD